MPETKIARFIGIEACKSVFSQHSTFVLRSAEHYRRLCETTTGEDMKGDGNEGIAQKIGGGTAEFTGFLASCWTALEGSEPTCDEWDIFRENHQNVIAIISTPSLVYEFLKTAFQIDRETARRRWPFLSLKHRKVCYEKRDIDRTTMFDIVPFVKNEKFKRQKEYRFVLPYAWRHAIDSLVFCGGIEYMRRSGDGRLHNFANPKMRQQDKEELVPTLMAASDGYGDFARMSIREIIANADILF